MRLFLITALIVLTCNCFAQHGKVKVFKKREYINGTFFRQTKGTIEVENEQIDIYFFKRHFQSPYYLPEKLIDKQYSGQTLLLWNDPDGKKDFQRNWRYNYSYDSLGRVTNFTYSSCILCSSLPYNYTITYNAKSQVEAIGNKGETNALFKFYYNDKGDIVKFEEYSGNMLAMDIILSDRTR